jgi:DNA-binding transcriptional MerR regulator
MPGARLYTVKQMLALAGICRNTLYKWEREERIPAPHRNVSGHRIYTEAQALEVQRYAKSLYPPTEEILRSRRPKPHKD